MSPWEQWLPGGIGPRWLVGDHEARTGDRVRLRDGREGTIVRTTRDWRGWPVIATPAGEMAVRPGDIDGTLDP